MARPVTVATCCLNQWSMDLQGNLDRIVQSLKEAQRLGAKMRIGPELEITGYSCQDHFYENDLLMHSWQILGELLQTEYCRDMLCSFGMPVMHKNRTFNCCVVTCRGKIVLIRPKMALCNENVYREFRWFHAWSKERTVEDHYLPRMIQSITGQRKVPFGDAVIATNDTCVGFEICQELWDAEGVHGAMSADGVEIVLNSSGSCHELRKLDYVVDLARMATTKAGGIYVFSNQRGCDGERMYYYGNSFVAMNGEFYARTELFRLKDVEVVSCTLDLERVGGYRNSQTAPMRTLSSPYPRIDLDFTLSQPTCSIACSPRLTMERTSAEDQLVFAPAAYLWDYLRRSGQSGYFLPLSGGSDSASVAAIVFAMCTLVCREVESGCVEVTDDLCRILAVDNVPNLSPKELCKELLHTCYMATTNSSSQTKALAQKLSEEIGASFTAVSIDFVVEAMIALFEVTTGKRPIFKVFGGSQTENLALQNVQARIRMVVAYFFAQLTLWSAGRQGSLLVLGTSNTDEALMGYLTKYDCSAADLNPIGSVSKSDVRRLLRYCRSQFGLDTLDAILTAVPTAELEPLDPSGAAVQSDEADIGMTYEELSLLGRCRKPGCNGPYGMFCYLVDHWRGERSPADIARTVKHFFRRYSINRHKMTVLTPALFLEAYTPDDHRNDFRPLLYNVAWVFQFRKIDLLVEELTQR